jgi:hypothetical protein
MDDSTKRLDTSAAFALCEEYSRLFPATQEELGEREKCAVEFVL